MEFNKRTDHWRHAAGADMHPEHNKYLWEYHPRTQWKKLNNKYYYCARVDMAWTIMLFKEGHIKKEDAKKILLAQKDVTIEDSGECGDIGLRDKVGGDEDLASIINYGRTQQEPMSRMQLRTIILEVFDEGLSLMESLLKLSEKYKSVMMQGSSHFSGAQPSLFGAYLLSVQEGVCRGLELLDLAYRHTNMNSGGCGACSGTGWKVDRELVSRLLGFDDTVVPVYDCEASQDEMLTIMSACSHMAILMSRTALDLELWTMKDLNWLKLDPSHAGVSYFMPQKAHSGHFEWVRIRAADILGCMSSTYYTFKGEPLQDVLPILICAQHVLTGLQYTKSILSYYRLLIECTTPNEEVMLANVKDTFSGAPDLARYLVQKKGYGGRRAHRICATMVRVARERKIAPPDVKAAMLDEAAEYLGEKKPQLNDKEVQDIMTYKNFFDDRKNLGDPHPDEIGRLVKERQKRLAELKKAQSGRKQRLADADKLMEKEIEAIIK